MLFEPDIRLGLVICVLAVAGAVVAQRRSAWPSAGLVVAYLANLLMIHWLGAAIELLPWFKTYDTSVVAAGFQQCVYGAVAVVLGAVCLAPVLWRVVHAVGGGEAPNAPCADVPGAFLPRVYFVVGLFSFLILFPNIIGATVTSLLANANQLLAVGPCLGCWRAWQLGDRRSFGRWVAVAFCLPLMTVIFQGFLGYGVVALITVLVFVAAFTRPRWRGLAVTIVLVYLGLSIYVTYMRDRSDIRGTVWGGGSLRERVVQLYTTFSTIEWFGLENDEHLGSIDARLNQNYLVGVAVKNLQSGYRQYAYGQTLTDAVLALVPRVIWPNKPLTAGSPRIVSEYTGIEFSPTTSVGVGQVMEFYLNFGTSGVLLGFFVLGGLVAFFDRAAARWLAAGDWPRFMFWFLPGLGFLQAGGQLVEVTSTVAAGFVTAIIVNQLVVPACMALFELPGRGDPQLLPAEDFVER
jgi:hypothetical protein